MKNILIIKHLLICISAWLSCAAYAEKPPNVGDVVREIEQNELVNPTTVNTPNMAQPEADADLTPIKVDSIKLKGRTLLSQKQLQPLIDKYIGTTTSLGGIRGLSRQISQAYQQAGYPLVTVVIPPQRITDGEVVLQIIEGSVEEITVSNNSRVADNVVQRYISDNVELNQPLRQVDSERGLLLVKDLAGTEQVSYQLGRGETGSTLAINLQPAPVLDGYVNVDNYGSDSTGEWRTRAHLNLNSPFGNGERLSLQAMSSFEGVDYAKLNGDFPLGYDGLNLNAGVSHTKYDLGGDFKDLDATGTADTIEAGFSYPVVRSNKNSIWLTTNGEYRDLEDEIGATNTTTDKTLQAIKVGLNGYFQDSVLNGGYTQWNLTNTFGDLDIDSDDARQIDAVSARTQGNYHKVNVALARTQYLSPKVSLYGDINGQWSDNNLDSVEQISLGGISAVSAYHSNDVSADIGVIAKAELRYAFTPNLTISAFYDAGRAKLRETPYTTGDNYMSLHGGGLGVYTNYRNLSLKGKVAWQGSDESFGEDDPLFLLNMSYIF